MQAVAWRQEQACWCGYRTSTDGVGPGGGDRGAGEGNLCGLGSRNRGLQWGSKGGKGLVKQVRDFRPFIQRAVESHGDILSRGSATSELRLRQVSETCNRENGFEDRRPGGWALTHPGRRLVDEAGC